MDSGQIAVKIEPLQLDRFLAESWDAISPIAEQRGLKIVWDLQSDRAVKSDRTHLTLILRNLFDNAVSHADVGSFVRIATTDDDDAVLVRITNTGSKVTATDVRHVFDRFWRGDTSRNGTGRHSGLGLSITKHLCDLLGISILAQSSQGGEFSVRLRFPARRLRVSILSESETNPTDTIRVYRLEM